MKQILKNYHLHVSMYSVAVILSEEDIDTLINCMELMDLDRFPNDSLLVDFRKLRKDQNANLDDIVDGADDTTGRGANIPALADETGRRQTTGLSGFPGPNALPGGTA